MDTTPHALPEASRRIAFPVADGSVFALPNPHRDGHEDLAWRLTYAPDTIDQTDRRLLASILNSYEALLAATDTKSRLVRRGYRDALRNGREAGNWLTLDDEEPEP